jgi:hypothetical protein
MREQARMLQGALDMFEAKQAEDIMYVNEQTIDNNYRDDDIEQL